LEVGTPAHGIINEPIFYASFDGSNVCLTQFFLP
jgi:hypothetical protein